VLTFRRLAAAACAAICSLALFAGPASARRAMRVEPAGEITKVVEEFTITAFGGEVSIICALTLRGRLAPQINKLGARRLPEGRIGQITSGGAERCRTNFGAEAAVTILVEAARPINLRYEAFLGVLPRITGILFRKLAFEFEVIEPVIIGRCLYSGPVALLMSFPPVEERGRRFNDERFVVPNVIPLVRGMLCPPEVELSGTGKVMPPTGLVLLD